MTYLTRQLRLHVASCTAFGPVCAGHAIAIADHPGADGGVPLDSCRLYGKPGVAAWLLSRTPSHCHTCLRFSTLEQLQHCTAANAGFCPIYGGLPDMKTSNLSAMS